MISAGVRAVAYKRYVLGILLLAYAFNFLDRQVLSVAMESIKADLALSDTQLGVITGAVFAVLYSLAGMPIARWADRGNRSGIIAWSLGLLAVTVALCSTARTFLQLMLARVGVGVAEAGVVPPAHSLVASYFERPERLRAMSIMLLGGPLSLAAGYSLGGWLVQWYGWRVAFLAIAAPGLLLTGLVRFTVREPRNGHTSEVVLSRSPRVTAASDAGSSFRQLFALMWGQPTFRHLLVAFAVEYLFGTGLVQWLPVFFIRVHSMSTGELGTWLAINWGVGNALGTLAGGYLTKGSTVNAERRQLRIMTGVAIVYVPINVAIVLAPDKHVALSIMFLGATLNALATAPSFAIIQSLVPEHMRATAVATIFLLANLLGLGIGPIVVGMLSDRLAHTYGPDSIRIALLACAPGYWWVAAQYYRASRSVMADLAEHR